jgi:hypothetical protein
MIQLNNHSIYMQMPGGQKQPLFAHDVAMSFCESQPLCAGLEPWQVEEIAEALIYHLRINLKRETIAFGEFVETLSKLAMVCGVNANPNTDPIPSANLYRLAQDTGYGFELAFFQNIERAIGEFRDRGARVMRFTELRPCVKMLVGAKSWGKSCQRLNDEIVDFIRERMLRAAEFEPITFVVAQ